MPAAKPIAWVDGRVLPAAEASIPLLDEGFLRGDAVFDAVLIRSGRTHALDAHLDRLRRSGRAMGIRVPVLRQVVTDLLAAWGDRDGSLRLIVTRDGTVRGIVDEPAWPPSVALHPVEMPWRSVLSGVKTLSYAANVWATREARAADADDAVVVAEGAVQEVPTAAIVWVADGGFHAPDPGRLPILDSVTLAAFMDLFPVSLDVHGLDDLLDADEVFLLSATRPVLPVHAVGPATFPAPGPETEKAREAFDQHIVRTLDPLP